MTTPFVNPGDATSALADRLRQRITETARNAPRSRQQAIGLSEVGQPCVRSLSYKILDWPKTNGASDPWPSISGTAIHSWLAEAFENDENYLVEHPVTVSHQLHGTADLFDIERGMVIDHKCVGQTGMRSRKKSGMTPQQRVQINLYGLGMENQGYVVNEVALAFYPLGGRLDGMHVIVEPYNRKIAMDAIERFESTQALVWQLDPEGTPHNWDLIPATPSQTCTYCPWFLPNSSNTAIGCKGASE
jgi:hypothetical protein